ncbi:hypothetical protein NEFER01_1532 [Nematocida sp. LUAm1]|nr:hypothetical protein NEFER02_1491 [Nematocida sp. LUAm2]KAI5178385.1 hypothetical protein NEFER01_1532 [Nematocida sp. LUAm1]
MQQTEQTQHTQAIPEKKKSKIAYYGIMSIGILSLSLFICATSYYKFYFVDPNSMGSFFYSWRVNKADDSMFKDKVGKFPPGTANEELAKFLKSYMNDFYPEHLPRGVEGYVTLAYPHMDMWMTFRQIFVNRDYNQALRKEKLPDAIKNHVKQKGLPVFYEELLEGEIYRRFDYTGKVLKERTDLFLNICVSALDLFINIGKKKNGYTFTGMNVPEKAVSDAENLLELFSDEKYTPYMDEYLASKLDNDDVKRFLKKERVEGESITKTLAHNFFSTMVYGVHPVYYSHAYSRLAYLIYFLTLDQDFGHPNEENSSFDNRQSNYGKRLDELGAQIAYVFSSALSPSLGQDVVSKTRNSIVNLLFTRSITEPSQDMDKKVENLLSVLEKRRDVLKSKLTTQK